jgi:hypothetical protein
MNTPEIGDLVLLEPHTNDFGRSDALVLDVEEDQSFCIAAVPELTLAGHLDIILDLKDSPLPYGLALLSHVGVWVDNLQIKSISGQISVEIVEALAEARFGRAPRVGRVGVNLLDGDFDPRWPALQKIAETFTAAYSITSAPEGVFSIDAATWKKEYVLFLRQCDAIEDSTRVLSNKEIEEFTFNEQMLLTCLHANPEVYSEDVFLREIDRARNVVRRSRQLATV